MAGKIIPERLAMVTHLYAGSHDENEGKMCVMEAMAFITGEPWSDYPECVCPVLATFLRTWNDRLSDDERDALLIPLIPKLVGTRGNSDLEERRSIMAADWLLRVNIPAWLRLAKMDAQAEMLERLPEITSMEQVPGILWLLKAVQHDVAKASQAIRLEEQQESELKVWSVFDSAAWSSAYQASKFGAQSEAELEAWSSAEAAAWLAASSAALLAIETTGRSVLADTKKSLQASALDLIERMIEARVA